MAEQSKNASKLSRFTAWTMLAGAMGGFTGCAADPIFLHRFDHCMDHWKSQEATWKKTYPQGYEMRDFCVTWANQGSGIGVLRAASLPQREDNEEG